MAADTTTLALLREARESVEYEMLTTGQDDRRQRARERLAHIDAHLKASEGAGVEWYEDLGRQRAVVNDIALIVFRSSERRGMYRWDAGAFGEGYAPTLAEAKAAALAAAGVR